MKILELFLCVEGHERHMSTDTRCKARIVLNLIFLSNAIYIIRVSATS